MKSVAVIVAGGSAPVPAGAGTPPEYFGNIEGRPVPGRKGTS